VDDVGVQLSSVINSFGLGWSDWDYEIYHDVFLRTMVCICFLFLL